MNVCELHVNGRVVGIVDESTVEDQFPTTLTLRVFDFDPAAFQAAQEESWSDGIKRMQFQLGDRAWSGYVDSHPDPTDGSPAFLVIRLKPS